MGRQTKEVRLCPYWKWARKKRHTGWTEGTVKKEDMLADFWKQKSQPITYFKTMKFPNRKPRFIHIHIALLSSFYIPRTTLPLEALHYVTRATYPQKLRAREDCHTKKEGKGEGKRDSLQDYSGGMYLSKEILQMILSFPYCQYYTWVGWFKNRFTYTTLFLWENVLQVLNKWFI